MGIGSQCANYISRIILDIPWHGQHRTFWGALQDITVSYRKIKQSVSIFSRFFYVPGILPWTGRGLGRRWGLSTPYAWQLWAGNGNRHTFRPVGAFVLFGVRKCALSASAFYH